MWAPFFIAAALLAGQDAEFLVKSGTEKLVRSDFKGAVQDFTRALDLDPKRTDAVLGRGKARYKLKSAAEADYTRAIDRGHDLESNYRERAAVRLGLPHLRGAISDLSRAILLEPKNAQLYANRSIACFGVQSWENALRDLQRVQALEGPS